jgi:hypothetical protein
MQTLEIDIICFLLIADSGSPVFFCFWCHRFKRWGGRVNIVDAHAMTCFHLDNDLAVSADRFSIRVFSSS